VAFVAEELIGRGLAGVEGIQNLLERGGKAAAILIATMAA
jgi:hypothetical protein